jgi:hypothetical protein
MYRYKETETVNPSTLMYNAEAIDHVKLCRKTIQATDEYREDSAKQHMNGRASL